MRRNLSPGEKQPAPRPESREAVMAGSLALSLVREALAKGARRLHLQPTADGALAVRMRTPDGLGAGPCASIEAAVAPLVVARLKAAARLDLEERRLPQKGQLTIQRVPEGPVALRVSTLPTTHGEALVVEALATAQALTLGALGLDPSDHERVREVLDSPRGLVLAVGPSGSGKRTFLHACLRHVAPDTDRTVVSIERDAPTEVPGVISVPVHHEIGLNPGHLFQFVRSRCDADVIHLCELSDPALANDAVTEGASGRLVLSALPPTGDAISAVTRLTDMGVEPYLVAAGLTAIVVCRALHVLCPACRVPTPAPRPDDLRRLVPRLLDEEIIDRWEEAFTARPRGCDACNGTGHRGRVGVYEVVHRPSEIIDEVMRSPDGLGHRTLGALHERTRTLRESALLRAYAGLVSITEAVNATPVAPGGAPPPPPAF